ncbi:MAG: hypothetical protein RLY14_1300 [Planctomycetota bacterium]|jgi:hypothetical protein
MKIAALALMLFASIGHAQDAKYLTQGKDFANSIAPTSAGQIVNPQGVNANAWSGTSIGSAPPKDLGAFSAPNTSSSAMDQAKSLGLMGLGNSAMDRCANYTPSGDPVKDQECAAVNFMSQRCLQPAGTQTQIVNANGGMQTNTPACEGSYGQGANKFDFFNQVKSSDTIFNLSNTATKDAGKTAGQSCVETDVITKPAQFETNTCFKSTTTNTAACSQFLRVGSYQEPGCTPGQFLTRVIADPCPRCVDKIVYDYTCTETGYRMHVFSMLKSNGALYSDFGSRDIYGRVGFNTGRTLGPNQHNGYFCYSTYYSQSCNSSTCTITSEFYNECQGTSFSGANSFLVPMVTKYNTYWDNQCRSLEQSAGISLGTP